MPGKSLTVNVSRWPVRAQLTYLLMVVLLPVFAALAWYFADERSRARAQALSEVQAGAERAAANIAQYMAEQELVLSRLAARPLVRALNARQCDPQLAEYVTLHPELVNLLLLDAQGTVVCSAIDIVPPLRSVANVSWWQDVQHSRAFHIGNAMRGSASRRWMVLTSFPLQDDDGRLAGVLAMPLDPLRINARLMQASPERVVVEVADGAGQRIFGSHLSPDSLGQKVAFTAPTLRVAAERAGGSSWLAEWRAGAPLALQLPVKGTPWTVESRMAEGLALAGTAAARNRVIAASLLLLTVGLLLAWRISLRIVRPIEALARDAQRVARGDTPVAEDAGGDGDGPTEIQAVAQQINRMLTAQARQERALASREEMFRSMFDNNPVPHLLQRAHACIVDVNAALLRASGYARDELVGHKVSELGLWADPGDMAHVTATLARDGRLDGFEGVVRLRSGERRFVLLSACSIEVDGELHFLHSLIDITERRRAEEAVREREERLSFLLSRTSAVIYTSRARGDFGTTFVSDGVVDLLGYAPEQFLADPLFWSSHLHPADAPGFFAAKPRLLQEGYLVQEYRFLHRDGQYRWIHDEIRLSRDADGQPLELIGFWVDVTQRRESERRVRENEARFRTLTALSSDWYWEQDVQFRFVRGALDEAGAADEDAPVGQTHWDTVALNLGEKDWERHRALLAAHQQFRDFEICRLDRQQRIRWISVSGTPIFDEHGHFGGYRGVGRDITAQKQAAEKIYQLAFFDSLTGLPNRRRLLEQLRRALMVAARNKGYGAVLFIDLDNFKSLNDTQGHDIGDLLLQQVASRLSGCVRGVDTVARLGGDEFVVLLDDLSAPLSAALAQAEVVGHKILQTLGQPYDLQGREHGSTPSIGVTLFGERVGNVEELLKQADLAMYQAKSAGRNTLRFFDIGMQAAVDRRVALEGELRQALAQGELLLHFQPVVQGDGRVIGAEALCRWSSPRRGSIPPLEFIPLAESTGLILPLGRWVLETACAQLVQWASVPALAHLSLAVNVSAHQFRDTDFVGHVLRTVASSGANPALIKFELTESLLAHNLDDVIAKMAALKSHGIGFSLDDFGTGYSSLSYLKRLPLTQIKIDQSFVRDVLTDPSDAAIARTIVALGESLQLNVVAEGVETEGQRAFLAGQGCHSFQGYLFSPPLTAAAFDSFVQGRQKPGS